MWSHAAAAAQGTANLARDAATAALIAAQDGTQAASALATTAQGTADTARTEAAAAGIRRMPPSSAGDYARHEHRGGAWRRISLPNGATGAVSAPSYSIDGQSYGNIGLAFAAVDDRLSELDTRIDALATAPATVVSATPMAVSPPRWRSAGR